jgi:hypothetical protein
MSKNALFSGQPIFSQIINHIPKRKLQSIVNKHNGDRYVKKFNSYHHLITMLYAEFQKCDSLRGIEVGMTGVMEKINHLGVSHLPKKSTLAEANERRNPQIFQDLYFELLSQYGAFLSDSRNALIDKRLFILDATVITLFNDILPAAGRKPSDGKRKGGIKVHTLLNAATDVPDMVVFDSAASRDGNVLSKIRLPEKSIVVFDKGYVSHAQFDRLSNDGVTWVTRLTTSWVYEMTRLREVDDHQRANGVLDDKEIILGNQTNKKQKRVKARLITYFDGKHNRTFDFITNNLDMSAITIAQLYEKRWQVELVFKRLKQNCQLRNFLGESENAIKIQIWIAFIADLLTNVIQKKIKGRRYAFTTIATILRLHLMSYFKLLKFLDNPHKVLKKEEAKVVEDLFSSA